MSFWKLIAIAAGAAAVFGQTAQRAKSAFQAGNYSEAARLFEAATRESVARESTRCDLFFYLGLSRYRLKQLDEAAIAFESATRCDPKMSDAQIALGDTYVQKGNRGEALAAYLDVLNREPENVNALRGAAGLYLEKEDNDKAVAVLERLVRADAGNAGAHADLGAAYAAVGNRQRAEAEFNQALRLKPADAPALTGLANLYLKEGDETRSIPLLKKAAAIAPRAFEPRFLLGSAYSRTHQYEEALGELKTALRLGGEQPEIYYQLARVYGALGREQDRQQALARFSDLTKRSKEDGDAQRSAATLMGQAKGLIDSGDLKGALTRMQQAERMRPADDKILFRLAGLEYDLQDYGAARSDVAQAIAVAPSEWLYHFLLGLIEKSSGHMERASASLETAVHLNPKAAEAYNALGEVALAQKDSRRAIASFERAAELDPGQAVYRANLESARGRVR